MWLDKDKATVVLGILRGLPMLSPLQRRGVSLPKGRSGGNLSKKQGNTGFASKAGGLEMGVKGLLIGIFYQ